MFFHTIPTSFGKPVTRSQLGVFFMKLLRDKRGTNRDASKSCTNQLNRKKKTIRTNTYTANFRDGDQ